MKFQKIELQEEQKIQELSVLATAIVREHFDPIIGKAQNDYMLQKFQTVDAITQQLQQGYQYYSMQNDDGVPVGFLAFYQRSDELYLSKFYLRKEERGRGYSRQMLNFVIEQTKQAGLTTIVLNVNRENPTIQAYEHMGFVKIGEEKNDIGNGFYMDDYVMCLTVC